MWYSSLRAFIDLPGLILVEWSLESFAASDCLPDRDFHPFAGQHRVGESFLTQLFDAEKKIVVVFGIVMGESQAFHAGHFRDLHGLIEAAVSPTAPFLQLLGRVLRVMDEQVRAARQLDQPLIDLLAVFNVRANDKDAAISLDPETIGSAGMIVPLSSDQGLHIVDTAEVLAGIGNLQELEIGSHALQLHGEVFHLHLDLEDLLQMADGLIPAQGKERDFLIGIIGWGKERKTLDMVPVKVRERDKDLFLLVPDGAEVAAQISQSRAGINDGDAIGIGERDLEAGGVTAELLETSITDWDGSPRPVKFELHRVIGVPLSPTTAALKTEIARRRASLILMVEIQLSSLFQKGK